MCLRRGLTKTTLVFSATLAQAFECGTSTKKNGSASFASRARGYTVLISTCSAHDYSVAFDVDVLKGLLCRVKKKLVAEILRDFVVVVSMS